VAIKILIKKKFVSNIRHYSTKVVKNELYSRIILRRWSYMNTKNKIRKTIIPDFV